MRDIIKIFIFSVIFLCVTACDSSNKKEILTQLIQKSNFRHIVEIDGVVEAVESKTIVCPEVWNVTISYLVEDATSVIVGDTVCILENDRLENEYIEKLQELEVEEAEYTKREANIALEQAVLNAQIKNNEAQTLIARLDSLQLEYSSKTNRKITELELRKTAIQKDKLLKKMDALENIHKSELKKMKLRIEGRKNRLQRTKDELNKLILTVESDGVALLANKYGDENFKVGDEIWPNQAIVSIPDLSRAQVKMQASETKYKQLAQGNIIEISFNSMPGNTAFGKLTKLARVGKPISRGSKIKSFEVIAIIDSVEKMPSPNLSANCQIIVNEVLDTIKIPLISLFEEDSLKYVYTKAGKKFKRKEVVLGNMSTKEAIVAMGLTFSEEIALVKPPESMVSNTELLLEEDKLLFKNRLDSIKKLNAEIAKPESVAISEMPKRLIKH